MIKNILSNWSNIFLSILTVFVLYPYCVQVLGEEQYGVWLLISSITGYFALLQLGVPLANVRFVSKYHALGEHEKVNEVVSSNFAFFSTLGFLVLIVGFGLAWLLDNFFQIPVEFKEVARLATIIVSVNIAMSFTFEVFEGILNALQKFVLINMVRNVLLLFRVGLTFLILNFKEGLLHLALLILFVTIVQVICFYGYIKIKHPWVKIRFKYIRYDVFRKVVGYSIFVLIMQVATRLSFNTDAMVIGRVISVSAIVFFTIGNSFLLYSVQFVTGISRALMPRVSELETLDDSNTLQELYLDYSRLTFLLVIPLCLGLVVFGGDFIALWMGEKYRIVSGNVLSILSVSYLFFLVQRGVAYPILMGTSKLKIPTIFMAGTAVLNLLLSIWWGKTHGLYGVAWGTTVPNLINVGAIIWFMCRTFKISLGRYVLRGVLIPLSAGGFFVGPALYLHSKYPIESYTSLFLLAMVPFLIYAISVFVLYFSKNQQGYILGKLGV